MTRRGQIDLAAGGGSDPSGAAFRWGANEKRANTHSGGPL
jgi:hypothetical protein